MQKMLSLLVLFAMTCGLTAAPVLPTRKDKDYPGPWAEAKGSTVAQTTRAATLDGYRRLAERIYGLQVTGGSVVYDLVLADDQIRAQMATCIQGAQAIGEPTYNEDGTVYVTVGVTLRKIYEVIDAAVQTINGKITFAEYSRDMIAEDTLVEALGTSALQGTDGLSMIRAKRAAEVAAFRAMAEKVIGMQITSKTNVRDMMLADDTIQSSVCAYLRGLKPTAIEVDQKGVVTVTLQLKVRYVYQIIEQTITRHKGMFRTKEEVVTKITEKIEDDVITASGQGAPRDETMEPVPGNPAQAVAANEAYSVERVVLKKLVASGVVVE